MQYYDVSHRRSSYVLKCRSILMGPERTTRPIQPIREICRPFRPQINCAVTCEAKWTSIDDKSSPHSGEYVRKMNGLTMRVGGLPAKTSCDFCLNPSIAVPAERTLKSLVTIAIRLWRVYHGQVVQAVNLYLAGYLFPCRHLFIMIHFVTALSLPGKEDGDKKDESTKL